MAVPDTKQTKSKPKDGRSGSRQEFDRTGVLWAKINEEWNEFYLTLKATSLTLFTNKDDASPKFVVDLLNKHVRALEAGEVRTEAPRRNCFLVEPNKTHSNKPNPLKSLSTRKLVTSPDEEETKTDDDAEGNVAPPTLVQALKFSSQNSHESLTWMAVLKRATVSNKWSGLPSVKECFMSNVPFVASNIPSLANSTVIDTPQIFRQKLAVCSCCWHFSPDVNDKNKAAKEEKRRILVELVQFIDAPRAQHAFIDDVALKDVIEMISINIFRPTLPIDMAGGPSDGSELLEPAWPHLSIVYELLLHVIESGVIPLDMKKRCFQNSFCIKIIQLFRSQDMREREYVKMVTHCIYSRLMNRRAAMRKAMSVAFLEFLYDTKVHDGIGEILEVYGSVASGFAVPIKPEHKDMLIKCLFPLHTSPNIESFHEQLGFILLQFSAKEPQLCILAIENLLRYWPNVSSKQLMFLNELEELVETARPESLAATHGPIVRKLCQCIEGEHFQVAERAISLWNNEALCSALLENRNARELVYPVLFTSLYRTWKRSWNSSVRQLAEGLLGFLQALDYDMYHRCEALRVVH